MNGELDLYLTQLKALLADLCETIGGLSEAQLNWRPPVADANSIFVIATHTLGNAESWVLGIACQQPIDRDRPAEFRASGASAAPIVAKAGELAQRIDAALAGLDGSALGESRQAPPYLWGAGEPRTVTVREALMHVVHHAAVHIGHIHVTRDLARAQGVA